MVMASQSDRRRQLDAQLAALYRYRREMPPHHGGGRRSVDERIRLLEAQRRSLDGEGDILPAGSDEQRGSASVKADGD